MILSFSHSLFATERQRYVGDAFSMLEDCDVDEEVASEGAATSEADEVSASEVELPIATTDKVGNKAQEDGVPQVSFRAQVDEGSLKYIQTNCIRLRVLDMDYASYEDMEVFVEGRPVNIYGYMVKVLASYCCQEELHGCSAFIEIVNEKGNVQSIGWALSSHPSFFNAKMGKYRLILLSCFNKDCEQ
ncbi:hypothetical protein Cyrtocomes_00032 [Candidatus Cyrtobacter comes]|uniref:Uncharacterized protein n=1 Tax=Candidatus Cyrtobacter comes TaxID=675776 RepID=A0ABU5L6C6_9RICK|nr:hypothetical protein [Candidatus Cyrtobacter comes]MDZ5761676.1 hypothetical protein [Candidatus Cyrtobacter comes]